MEFPALHVLDQNFETLPNADAEGAVAEELERTNFLGPLAAGQKVGEGKIASGDLKAWIESTHAPLPSQPNPGYEPGAKSQ